MHVGYGCSFQNPENRLSDTEVYDSWCRPSSPREPRPLELASTVAA